MRVIIECNNKNTIVLDEVIKITEDYTGKKYKFFKKDETHEFELENISIIATEPQAAMEWNKAGVPEDGEVVLVYLSTGLFALDTYKEANQDFERYDKEEVLYWTRLPIITKEE